MKLPTAYVFRINTRLTRWVKSKIKQIHLIGVCSTFVILSTVNEINVLVRSFRSTLFRVFFIRHLYYGRTYQGTGTPQLPLSLHRSEIPSMSLHSIKINIIPFVWMMLAIILVSLSSLKSLSQLSHNSISFSDSSELS